MSSIVYYIIKQYNDNGFDLIDCIIYIYSQLCAKFYFLPYLKIETNKFISINKLKMSYDYVIRKDY